MDRRDTFKFYSIKNYGLQVNKATMPRNFYGYLKAREIVIAPVSHPCQLPETRPLQSVLDSQQRKQHALVSRNYTDHC